VTYVTAKGPTKRAAKHNNIPTLTSLQQQQQHQQKQQTQEQQQQTQRVQQQKHKSTHDLTTIQKGTRATTAINVRNNIRFGAVLPAK
jgi:hypothetical protein